MWRNIAEPFGIKFGGSKIYNRQIVHFLDLALELVDGNQIQYRLYKKDTNA